MILYCVMTEAKYEELLATKQLAGLPMSIENAYPWGGDVERIEIYTSRTVSPEAVYFFEDMSANALDGAKHMGFVTSAA